MDKCKECGETCTCKLSPSAKKVKKEALVDIIKAKSVLVNSNVVNK